MIGTVLKSIGHTGLKEKKTIISFEKGREDVLLYCPFLGRWPRYFRG